MQSKCNVDALIEVLPWGNTMFKLLKKLYVQIFGRLHDAVDEHSDVGVTARHGVRQLTEQIGRAEESIASIDAEYRLMLKAERDAQNEGKKWEEIASTAAQSGNRDEAMRAIGQQVSAEERAHNYSNNAVDINQAMSVLNHQLAELKTQLSQRQAAASVLSARSTVAKAKSQAARSLGNVGNNPGVDFDALSSKVDRQEAKAAALSDMSTARTESNADMKLAEIRRRDAIAERATKLGLLTVDQQATTIGGKNNA